MERLAEFVGSVIRRIGRSLAHRRRRRLCQGCRRQVQRLQEFIKRRGPITGLWLFDCFDTIWALIAHSVRPAVLVNQRLLRLFFFAPDNTGAFGSCQWRLIIFVSAC
jgi:hypothetical protein